MSSNGRVPPPTLSLEARLLDEDEKAFIRLGTSVSFDGTRILAGAVQDDPNDSASGMAILFERSEEGSWGHTATFTPNERIRSDRFGSSLSIRGNVALIAAPAAEGLAYSDDAAAYVFERTSEGFWNQTARFGAVDGIQGERFAAAVDTDGEQAVIVAASLSLDHGSGSLYTYIRKGSGGWTSSQRLLASEGAQGCLFTSSVSLGSGALLVGCRCTAGSSSQFSGAACAYERIDQRWRYKGLLLADEGSPEGDQVIALSIGGDIAAVPALSIMENSESQLGLVHTFARVSGGNWTKAETLSVEIEEGVGFGTSMSLSDVAIVVGAHKYSNETQESGAAYAFFRNHTGNWSLPGTTHPSVPNTNQHFGVSVSTANKNLVIGAPRDVVKGPDGGAVYVFCWEDCRIVQPTDVSTNGSAAPTPPDEFQSPPSGTSSSSIAPIVIAIVLAVFLSGLLMIVVVLKRKRNDRIIELPPWRKYPDVLELRRQLEGKVNFFSVEVLENATNSFDQNLEVGGGMHTTVYQGTLMEGTPVAVKRWNTVGHEAIFECCREADVLCQIRHPNLVRLLGCCSEQQELAAVYELMERGSLDAVVDKLSWEQVEQVALDVAKALAYLHGVVHPGIVHGHLKSSEILLDGRFTAHVSDFRFSKSLVEGRATSFYYTEGSLTSSSFRESWYCAPEYSHENKISSKVDVYSYGIVLLELLSLLDPSALNPLDRSGLLQQFLESSTEELFHRVCLARGGRPEACAKMGVQALLQVAKWCLRDAPHDRPTMGEIVTYLQLELL